MAWVDGRHVRPLCTVPGCGKPHESRGYCSMHYRRWRVHGDPLADVPDRCRSRSLAEKFWERVDVRGDDECWPWLGGHTPDGFGTVHVGGYERWIAGTYRGAHRIALLVMGRSVPDGMQVDHLCHTFDSDCYAGKMCPHRRCVNPSHLEVVTPEENTRRGRRPVRTHCKNGHELTPANTRVIKDGERRCKTCVRESMRRYVAARKAAV